MLRLFATVLSVLCVIGLRVASAATPALQVTAVDNYPLTTDSPTIRYDQQQIAYSTNSNNFLLVYIKTTISATSSETSLVARFLTASGQNQAPYVEYVMLDYQTASQTKRNPAVVYNPSTDQFFVAFEFNANGDGVNFDIYATYISGKGQMADFVYPIAEAGYNEANPSVTYNSKDNVYAVAWEADISMYTQLGVSRVTANLQVGKPVFYGFSNGINKQPQLQYVPTDKYAGYSDYYIIVFTAADPAGDGKSDLYSAVALNSGNDTFYFPGVTVVSVVLEVNYNNQEETHAVSTNPSICVQNNQAIGTFWEVIGSSGEHYIAALLINDVGSPTTYLIDAGGPSFIDRHPSATYNKQSSVFMVTYEAANTTDANGNSVEPNIAVSLLDNNLAVIEAAIISNSPLLNNERYPKIVGNGDISYVLVWLQGDPVPPQTNGFTNTTKPKNNTHSNSTHFNYCLQNTTCTNISDPTQKYPCLKNVSCSAVARQIRSDLETDLEKPKSSRPHLQNSNKRAKSPEMKWTSRSDNERPHAEARTPLFARPKKIISRSTYTPLSPSILAATLVQVTNTGYTYYGNGDGGSDLTGLIVGIILGGFFIVAITVVLLVVFALTAKLLWSRRGQLSRFGMVQTVGTGDQGQFQQFHDEEEDL